jgi:hypothetical protein|tara:strand:- start:41 stop:358 length:318 start_codon:yes stop_codon:yes gene_type:complete
MAHFAKLDSSNIVTDVIVSEKDFINSGVVGDEFLWIQTSYNNNFRKQFAGIGDTYDIVKNKFIKPQPFTSWILDASDDWQPPTAYPDDDKRYEWNEDTTAWVEIT